MKLRKALLISTLLLFVAAAGFGCAARKTETAEGQAFKMFPDIVDADFVKKHITIPMSEDVMIIDARPERKKYNLGHIPMAVNIPFTSFDKMTNLLPKNKNALLIYYCEGIKCALSHKSAFKAKELGYKNVKVYAKGYPEWVKINGNYAQVPALWVKKMIDSKKEMALIDSRPYRMKYKKGHIPTAISIPDSSFDKMTDKLPKDKNALLVFYCGGFNCKLSHKSASKAIALGYTNVKVFSAGFPAWKELLKATAKKTVAIKAGEEEGSINLDVFKKIMAEDPSSVLLVDVRDKDEFARGSLKTAINIPVDALEAKIQTLPTDKPIVFICGTGARSGESYYMVKDVKPSLKDVFYLDAELTIHKDGSFSIKKVE